MDLKPLKNQYPNTFGDLEPAKGGSSHSLGALFYIISFILYYIFIINIKGSKEGARTSFEGSRSPKG